MSYSNVLVRTGVLVRKDFINLLQGLLALHNVPKHRVLAIKIVDIVAQRNEELTATSTLHFLA